MQSPLTCSSVTLTEPRCRRNVLIVGDVGVGKSSFVNLIAGQEIVTPSPIKSCTLQSQEYFVTLNDVEFVLYDTASLHEIKGDMKKSEYLQAIYQAYSLISKLEQSGGISLLMFCMRGGRISVRTQQTYHFFAEVFCGNQVPILIIVTQLEMLDPMERWWAENERDLKNYGFESVAHACITAIRGLGGAFTAQYEESGAIVRKLLLEHSGQVAYRAEMTDWVKRVAAHMRVWLSPSHARQLDRGDWKKKLIKQCGFSREVADFVAQKMEQSPRMLRKKADHDSAKNSELAIIEC